MWVQGIANTQADAPEEVNEAVKEVSAAQQSEKTYLNEARAYAQQLSAKAKGESAAFDKVYAEYKLAPEVTRRRMYYETMEEVLSNVEKNIHEATGVTPYPAQPADSKRTEPETPAAGSGGRREGATT